MYRILDSIFLMILVASVVQCGLAQDGDAIFRTSTELALVEVQVVRKGTGVPAGPLDRKDLQVYEDGALQEISILERDRLPLSVVLLLDLTQSVRPVLKRLAGSAREALAHLKAEDEIAVIAYSASAQLMDGFSTNREQTVAAIDRSIRMNSKEAAFFNEALYQAGVQFRQAKTSSRHVVIWLTDDLPNVPAEWVRSSLGKSVPRGALHNEDQAFETLYQAEAVVAPLLMKSVRAAPLIAMQQVVEAPWRLSNPPGSATKFARLTGGQVTKLRGKDADQKLSELIDNLRSRYTIGYKPSTVKPNGTFCKVRVMLSRGSSLKAAEWDVLSTSGYYRR